GIPVYVKIRETLRDEITNGLLKRGERLPPEHELATKFSVSRMTIRESLEDLVDEGLLYRRHGVGTFVAFPHLQRDHTRLTSFFDKAEEEGVQVRAELLGLEVMTARAVVARALDLPPGSRVIRIKTLRYANNVPITVHEAYVPQKLFANIVNEDLEHEHLWSLIERCGYKVKRAVQRLEARDADKELAELMKIKEGSPILFKERTVYAADGTPVEFTYCYNRGDAYSLTVALER
ncbi:MAG TPA: GntR family transcriptional regulator, partial [Anaerolineales bacterium]|nr:GntR family transcriptional regulator [Anaerolineales bacterium]